jgi:hypothetical protein
MKEQNFDKSQQQKPLDLEQRLTSFYGPPLRDQPLSSSSWQNLRLRLDSQADARRKLHFHWPLPQRRSRTAVPAFILDAFSHVSYVSRMPYMPSMLRCSLQPQIHEPIVRNSWLGRRKIRLLLPLNAGITMGQAELDVLLATGLARSIYARKPVYVLARFLLICVVLLASITLTLLWTHHLPLPFIGIPIAIMLYAGVPWLLNLQARSIAFHADTLTVLWLGRNHVCSGLHSLADRSRTPMRSRWGEPSLAERIERVCGTRAGDRNNQLTLVG